ncbi:MAG: hypothetical protein DRQ60_03120 [Gammaproteobacteria bacterium]|nr:MAG: hypothetical protein DRQ54_04365 [Gammaproteobacteria bacterium]RLA14398.1 MAG: hypothetical protein DRQ52_04320 [Gammaproteobacteria bacterium]RLA17003.1 MAG: hypothetical protein DRQ60_03120 [Gammaproteobacteria bacterium]
MTENPKPKQRLVGVIVLLALAVILLPVLVDYQREPDHAAEPVIAPPAPTYHDYQSRVVPIDVAPAAVDKPDQGEVSREDVSLAEPVAASSVERKATIPVARLPEKPPSTEQAKTTPPARQFDKGWVVQVGSFSNAGSARKVKSTLLGLGFDVFIEPVKTPSGVLQRVRIGPEFQREDAEALQQKLQKSTQFKGVVLMFP